MRYGVGLLLSGACGLTGCFAPFTRPEDRVPATAVTVYRAVPDDAPLMQAAEALDRGDEKTAADRMSEYVAANPSAVMPRAHLAELLYRQGRVAEARRHYERYVADAQPATGAPRRHLAHCHTRLMSLAEVAGDAHAEALHRGIGLLVLAERDAPDETTEPTLAKALDALQAARDERPDSARAHIYLARTLRALGQASAARQSLGRARDCLPDATLTPTERAWIDD